MTNLLVRSRASGCALLWFAAALGTFHAAWSAYWAVGGTGMLTTVGEWAVELSAEQPLLAGLGLGVLALAKLAGAWIPVAAEYGRIAGRRWWRLLGWVGGAALACYGGANALVNGAVLAGLIAPPDGGPTDATTGHALLWGPLFLCWGAALVTGLALTRTVSHRGHSQAARAR